MRENSFVSWLQAQPQPNRHDIRIGIGDDAAVIEALGSQAVVTTDLIAEGVHFDSDDCSLAEIGYKAMAVNLSDIAAMAAKPVAAFVSLLLPQAWHSRYVEELVVGAMTLGNQFGCVLAGGDTNVWAGELAINVLVIGQVTARGPITRDGARPGDRLLVTGYLGDSISGHHLRFVPRIAEALTLNERYSIHSGMDLSDGLALDLRRLCTASGCGAEINVDQLPISSAAIAKHDCRTDQIQSALGDGEDFELLLAVPEEEAGRIVAEQPLGVPVTDVGQCTESPQVVMLVDGVPTQLPMLGYEHGQ